MDSSKLNKGVEVLCPLALWEQDGGRGWAGSWAVGIWVPVIFFFLYKENVMFPPAFSFYFLKMYTSNTLNIEHITQSCVSSYPYVNLC